jgi:hypothetical protein
VSPTAALCLSYADQLFYGLPVVAREEKFVDFGGGNHQCSYRRRLLEAMEDREKETGKETSQCEAGLDLCVFFLFGSETHQMIDLLQGIRKKDSSLPAGWTTKRNWMQRMKKRRQG